MSYDSGMVTIPLSTYEHYRQLEQELETVKAALKTEKEKTWSMFGKFFDQPRKLDVVDDFGSFTKRLYIKVHQPVTVVDITPYDVHSEWDVFPIVRHLIENHIQDVVRSVNMGKMNLYKELRS